ncbi:MAG: sigma 54-interacting transcriptional regulator [Proteobacteria bacterium]|nr:sigma 54-interacting transcriptional regulator [Pseudomonadota bacterium]MBU1386286.1 sigma 54-interacting transcriptional regulator [Pseudomonadota bacterium]MBU1542978.1 sigma 54-interacting transcriptional regulator [Pseudomonadota bacterium]MBU2480001.1 sigma 54-interacting transcriptional regulator [Pseudomonadota bacterium]
METCLNKQLEFERLLFEISSQFVNLPAADVDKKINDALKKIVQFLDFDQIVFGEFRGNDGTLKIIHGYTSYQWKEPKGLLLNTIAPNFTKRIRCGEVINLSHLPDDLPDNWETERAYVIKNGLKSCVGVSLNVGGSVLGVIIFESYRRYQQWTDHFFNHLRLLAQVFANALERKQADIKLKQAFGKIQDLSDRLKAENEYLRETISTQNLYEDVIGKSPAFQYVLGRIEQVAKTASTVLFVGETGTGKTHLSQLIHRLSLRKNKTMVKVNCATLPANLLESELFGHEKGAFTGAVAKKVGRFEIADESTLFLDEIGELPLDLQAKLLRVLDDGEFERLGSVKPQKVNVRIVAATNRDLSQMMKERKFRADLFYRLNVYPISIPPLRKRLEDIPEMVWAFVKEFCKTMGRNIKSIPQKDIDAIVQYPWPGNIRELKNVIENAMISTQGEVLRLFPPELSLQEKSEELTFDQTQKNHILTVLKTTHWRIKGPDGAAERLDLKPSTLYSKMKKLGIVSGRYPKEKFQDRC